MCIRFRGNVSTEPLPSNDRKTHIQKRRLKGGIYEVRRRDRLSYHDIHTKFHKDWLMHSKFNKGDTETHRQHDDRIGNTFFFKVRKVGQKCPQVISFFQFHSPSHGHNSCCDLSLQKTRKFNTSLR
jgi:hypothetical protein